MNRLVVAEHAFKHGLNEESIRYAWEIEWHRNTERLRMKTKLLLSGLRKTEGLLS